MVEVHIYGKLRRYAKDTQRSRGTVVVLEPRPDENIGTVLECLAIPVDEINHIFLNAKLLATRTKIAPFLGYPQSRSDLFHWDLSIPVADGDRIGLFGADMTMLGM